MGPDRRVAGVSGAADALRAAEGTLQALPYPKWPRPVECHPTPHRHPPFRRVPRINSLGLCCSSAPGRTGPTYRQGLVSGGRPVNVWRPGETTWGVVSSLQRYSHQQVHAETQSRRDRRTAVMSETLEAVTGPASPFTPPSDGRCQMTNGRPVSLLRKPVAALLNATTAATASVPSDWKAFAGSRGTMNVRPRIRRPLTIVFVVQLMQAPAAEL